MKMKQKLSNIAFKKKQREIEEKEMKAADPKFYEIKEGVDFKGGFNGIKKSSKKIHK